MPVKKDIRSQVDGLSLSTDEDYFEAPISVGRSAPVPPRGSKAMPHKVVLLPSVKLVEYEDKHFEAITGRPQPFFEYDDDEMTDMIASVAKHGVLEPITVRPYQENYQIIAGRHRNRASIANGFKDVPAIIRDDIDDVQAAWIMLETNLIQRHNLKYSEKAWAYRMARDLMKKQGKRSDLNKDLDDPQKIDTLSEIGKKNKDSRSTVANLISLTYLIPELLEMVDEGKLGIKVALKIYRLRHETQHILFDEFFKKYGIIKIGQATKLMELQKDGLDTRENILTVMHKSYQEKSAGGKITISRQKFADYIDLAPTDGEFEKLILKLLAQYRASLSSKGA